MSEFSIFIVVGIGFITGIGLIIGSLVGLYVPLTHKSIARIMSLGAGMLLAAAAVELVVEVFDKGPLLASIGLAVGAIGFSSGNFILANYSAGNRKRCGECVQQPSEEESPGSGLAIALGTVMDAIPESLVLGMVLKAEGLSIALIAAITIGNAPEAMSSSAGMKSAGRSIPWILGLWGGLALVSGLLTGAGYTLHDNLGPNFAHFIQAFGAGAILSMISETLLPEAAHDSPSFSGILAVIGFIGILLFGLI